MTFRKEDTCLKKLITFTAAKSFNMIKVVSVAVIAVMVFGLWGSSVFCLQNGARAANSVPLLVEVNGVNLMPTAENEAPAGVQFILSKNKLILTNTTISTLRVSGELASLDIEINGNVVFDGKAATAIESEAALYFTKGRAGILKFSKVDDEVVKAGNTITGNADTGKEHTSDIVRRIVVDNELVFKNMKLEINDESSQETIRARSAEFLSSTVDITTAGCAIAATEALVMSNSTLSLTAVDEGIWSGDTINCTNSRLYIKSEKASAMASCGDFSIIKTVVIASGAKYGLYSTGMVMFSSGKLKLTGDVAGLFAWSTRSTNVFISGVQTRTLPATCEILRGKTEDKNGTAVYYAVSAEINGEAPVVEVDGVVPTPVATPVATLSAAPTVTSTATLSTAPISTPTATSNVTQPTANTGSTLTPSMSPVTQSTVPTSNQTNTSNVMPITTPEPVKPTPEIKIQGGACVRSLRISTFYTVEFVVSEKTISKQEIEYGGSAVEPNSPQKLYYIIWESKFDSVFVNRTIKGNYHGIPPVKNTKRISGQYVCKILTPRSTAKKNDLAKKTICGTAVLNGFSKKMTAPIKTTVKTSEKDKTGKTSKMSKTRKKAVTTAAHKVKSITLPQTTSVRGLKYRVTQIARNAFKGYKNIKLVKLPSTITTIGGNAFNGISKRAVFRVPAKNIKRFTKLLTPMTGFNKKKMKIKAYR